MSTTRISSPASHPASQKASLWTGPRAGVLRCATRTSRGWVPAELCPFFSLRAEGRSLPPHFSATLPETSVNDLGFQRETPQRQYGSPPAHARRDGRRCTAVLPPSHGSQLRPALPTHTPVGRPCRGVDRPRRSSSQQAGEADFHRTAYDLGCCPAAARFTMSRLPSYPFAERWELTDVLHGPVADPTAGWAD